MIKIGITGGIGSGKSHVCSMFEKIYIPVFYTDIESKNILQTNEYAKKFIIENYGEESYIDGKINSKHLANILFNDNEEMDKVSAIVKPILVENLNKWFESNNHRFITMVESAILFESGLDSMFDYIIYVDAPSNVRLERVLKRDPQRDNKEVLAIMSKQLPSHKAIKKSNIVILNDSDSDLTDDINIIKEKLYSTKKSNRGRYE